MLGQKCCEVVCSFVDFVTTVQKSQRYLLEQLVDECWTLIILLSILRSATTLKQLTGEVNDSDSLVCVSVCSAHTHTHTEQGGHSRADRRMKRALRLHSKPNAPHRVVQMCGRTSRELWAQLKSVLNAGQIV
uniref:Uncharacterized protein n=1 Tax=Anabas testudineus TaxID=64144 RepID=A0A3Q1HAM3_ANATE